MSKSVLLGMSGGVDSSVAAALLKEQGYHVIGATMKIWDEGRESSLPSPRICCSLKAVEDAMAVCQHLQISYRILEYQDYFKKEIVQNFCSEYRQGRTPNPCVICNSRLKFYHFLHEADSLGCDFIATGHYARIGQHEKSGKFFLKRGMDLDKDQSYFLYGVTQSVLSRLLFPVGSYTKNKVRALAESFRLPVAQKQESQEICFIPDNDYAAFLKRQFPDSWESGKVLDKAGNVLGEHSGTMHYTIGQRRGLGIAYHVPLYVVKIHTEENVVVVGRKEDLYKRSAVIKNVNWISGSPPESDELLTAKIRYRHEDADVSITSSDERIGLCDIVFREPQEAITPGQSVVFYAGEIVVGGGVIDHVKEE